MICVKVLIIMWRLSELNTYIFVLRRGCTEPGMSGVAQFGNGSVRDRKNGLLDGDVVEWEWAEREREEKSERGN